MKIRIMQSGGGMPPFTYYQPVMINTEKPNYISDSNSDSSKSSKKELGEVELMKMLGELDGLPSDREQIYKTVRTFFDEQSLGMSTSSLATTYLTALNQLKTAKFNKEQFDNAYKVAEKNQALSEIAVTESGHVVVKKSNDTTGSLLPITINEYMNNQDKYIPITNAQLLQHRAYDLPHANSLLNIVNNSISLPMIDKLISQYFTQLGTDEQQGNGYIKSKNGQILQGIEFLQDAVIKAKEVGVELGPADFTISGLYKTKFLTKSQAQQAQNSLAYIYKMLPDNAKTLLTLKSGGAKEALDTIANMLYSTVSQTSEFIPELIEDEFGNKPGSKEKSDDDKMKTDLFTNIARGQGGTQTTFNLMDEDGKTLQLQGTAYPSLSVNPNKPVEPQGTAEELLTKYGLIGLTPGQGYAVTFGNKILQPNDMQEVVYLNDGNATRTLLPIIKKDGKIVPDVEFIKKNSELIELINSKHGNFEDPEVQKQLINSGLVNPYTGLPDMSKFHPYLCINGLTTDRNFKDIQLVQEIKGDSLDQYINIYENAVYKKKTDGDQGKEYKYNFDRAHALNPFDWFDNYDHLYKGTIFIPLTQNIIQTSQASGYEVNQHQADQLELDYQRGELSKAVNLTSSNLLGL